MFNSAAVTSSWSIQSTNHLAKDDLWSQVLRSATQRPGPTFDSFGKTEVCDLKRDKVSILEVYSSLRTAHLYNGNVSTVYLNIPLLIYEQVLRLQVSVNEVQGVKVLKGQYYLSCIKSCMLFTERSQDGQSDTGAKQRAFQCHIGSLLW